MKTIKIIIAAGIIILTAGGVASAAECTLRNITFVGVVGDGRLVVNADIHNSGGTKLGALANSTFCRVNTTHNNIASQTCQAWNSTAMTAFLSYKKIYITADSCTVGNGVALTNIGYFGINH